MTDSTEQSSFKDRYYFGRIYAGVNDIMTQYGHWIRKCVTTDEFPEEETIIDEDEVRPEDETPELITKFQNVNKHVPTIFYRARMKATLNEMLSNQFRNAEEYAYHLEQATNFMENLIVWESRQEDIGD
ncbi:hypothetical protein Tco_1538296 [Tanacetum coccineum]